MSELYLIAAATATAMVSLQKRKNKCRILKVCVDLTKRIKEQIDILKKNDDFLKPSIKYHNSYLKMNQSKINQS